MNATPAPLAHFDIDSLIQGFESLNITNREILEKLDEQGEDLGTIKKQLGVLQLQVTQLMLSNQTYAQANVKSQEKIVQLIELISEIQLKQQGPSSAWGRGFTTVSWLVGTGAKFATWVFTPFFWEVHRNAHNFAKGELKIRAIALSSEAYTAEYRTLYWNSFNFQLTDIGITGKMLPGFENIIKFLPEIQPMIATITDAVLATGSQALSKVLGSDNKDADADADEKSPISSPYLKQILLVSIASGVVFTGGISYFYSKRKKQHNQNDIGV